jgi:UDP-N-acetyl-2-amino-2-deoxyglucuronate dehydrogenase
MARTYGFGVVGLGMGMAHGRRIQGEKRARVAAVCDVNAERGQKAAAEFDVPWYSDFKSMLRDLDVDIVLVATPTGMHAEFAIAAARAGKHVLCEKPIDVDLPRARRIVAACRRAGVKLQVGFQNRCTQASLQTARDIRDGRIGRLLFGEMILHWWRSGDYFKPGGWRGTWKYDGGGAFMNQAVHYVDLLVWFMGRPVSVVGRTKTLLHTIETEDVGMAIVEFEGGAQASLIATTTAHPIERDSTRLYLQGSEGSIAMAGSYTLERTDVHLAPARTKGRPPLGTTLYADLIDAIERDREPLASGEEALTSLAVIKAIYRSSQTGREVKINADFGMRNAE